MKPQLIKKDKKPLGYTRRKYSFKIKNWRCSTISTLDYFSLEPPDFFWDLHKKLVKVNESEGF